MFVPLTPIRCLHRAVDLFGSRIGVVSGDRQFTYAELGQRAERLATGFQKLGIAAGDRVAYLSHNTHQLLEGYFGVIQARAILLPLNVRLAEPELAAILRHSGAIMVIFEDDFADTVQVLRRSCPEVKHWVAHEEVVDQGYPERACVVPAMANAVINVPDRGARDLSSLKTMNIGGTTIRVVDSSLRDVPRDHKTIGEVIAMGDQSMDGYFGDPDATHAAMSGPWLHTGDMAVWDEDGYIQIVEFSIDPLPKTGTEKIRKNELRERFWASKAARVQG